MSTRPVIGKPEDFSALFPKTGFSVDAGKAASKMWEQLQGSQKKPEEPKKINAAEDLAVKLDAYINQARTLEIMGDAGTAQPTEDYNRARDAFYEAFRVRIKECDCKVAPEDLLIPMFAQMVPTRLIGVTQEAEKAIRQRLMRESLHCSVSDVAKRCAEELFALSEKQESQIAKKVGLVASQEVEGKIIANCPGLNRPVARVMSASCRPGGGGGWRF